MTEGVKIFRNNVSTINNYFKDYIESIGLDRSVRIVHNSTEENPFYLTVTIDKYERTSHYIVDKICLIKDKINAYDYKINETSAYVDCEFYFKEETFLNNDFIKSLIVIDKYNL